MWDNNTPELAEAHRRELMEAARIYRLAHPADGSKPRYLDRLLLAAGSFLISMGVRLQERCRSCDEPVYSKLARVG